MFVCFGCTHSMYKFPGQGLNLHHSIHPTQAIAVMPLKWCITKELLFLFFGYFLPFRATPMAHGGYQARGQIGAAAAGLHHSPQQCRIWAISVTYTTAQGNARPLTHWARPGIKPASSWMLVRWARWELPIIVFLTIYSGQIPTHVQSGMNRNVHRIIWNAKWREKLKQPKQPIKTIK